MIHGPWASPKNEPIPIKSNTYEDFKELITFFYIDECKLTPENIEIMLDLAEVHGVLGLKKQCQTYLINKALNLINIIQAFGLALKYSLKILISESKKFISKNTETILKSDEIVGVSRKWLIEIVKLELLSTVEESIFDAVGYSNSNPFSYPIASAGLFFVARSRPSRIRPGLYWVSLDRPGYY